MTVEYILRLLPGPYWNEGKLWTIYEHGEIIFSGTWDEAMDLPETILSRKVWSYESKTITPRTIDHHIWDAWTKLYLDSMDNKSNEEKLKESVELARSVGVPEDKILHNKEEIDKFFQGNSGE